MTCHKGWPRYQIRLINRLRAKAQVGNRNTAGLLRIVVEVRLRIHIRMVADNLNGRFISTNGTIGAKAPEFTSRNAFCRNPYVRTRQGQMRYVVHDTDGKYLLNLFGDHVIENSDNIGRDNVTSS